MGSGYFSFSQRDPHHWDVSDGKKRVFAIRGAPGDVQVRDERGGSNPLPRANLRFKSIHAAILWISDEMGVAHDL